MEEVGGFKHLGGDVVIPGGIICLQQTDSANPGPNKTADRS
jgi:hypothetical protein